MTVWTWWPSRSTLSHMFHLVTPCGKFLLSPISCRVDQTVHRLYELLFVQMSSQPPWQCPGPVTRSVCWLTRGVVRACWVRFHGLMRDYISAHRPPTPFLVCCLFLTPAQTLTALNRFDVRVRDHLKYFLRTLLLKHYSLLLMKDNYTAKLKQNKNKKTSYRIMLKFKGL